jgi:prevent-host-death family protein
MHTVNVHEAKTHLSRLLDEVAAGGEVVIAKAGRPVARLIGYGETPDRRQFGRDAGLLEIPADFDDFLPEEVIAGFEE